MWTTGNGDKKITWNAKSIYIDVDTAELITKQEIEEGRYKILKTTKKTSINETIGTIEYTNECKRNERYQGTLF